MKWEKWVERQLRQYLCRTVDIEYIERQLKRVDQYVRYPTSFLDGMPRASSFTSGVERQILAREKLQLFWLSKLENLQQCVEVVERAIEGLHPSLQELIRLNYFTFTDEREILTRLGLTLSEFKRRKAAAMDQLYFGLIDGYRSLSKSKTKQVV